MAGNGIGALMKHKGKLDKRAKPLKERQSLRYRRKSS